MSSIISQYGNDALRNLGINLPALSKIPKTQKPKIVPLSYYLLGGAALIGVIGAVAGYALANVPVIIVGVGVAFVSGFGAYEIKRLSLNMTFNEQVGEFKTYIDRLVQEVRNVRVENLNLNGSIIKLTTEIDVFKDAKNQIVKLTDQLKEANDLTGEVTEQLHAKEIAFQALNTDFQKKLDRLVEEKNDIQLQVVALTNLSELTKEQNTELEANIEKLSIFYEKIKQENEDLLDENFKFSANIDQLNAALNNTKKQIEDITKERDEFQNDFDKFKKEHDLLQNDIKTKEAITKSLEDQITNLETKITAILQKLNVLKGKNKLLKLAQAEMKNSHLLPAVLSHSVDSPGHEEQSKVHQDTYFLES
jgi:chromosome segregation ATPase